MSIGGGEARRGGLWVRAVLNRRPSNDDAMATTSGGGGCRSGTELEEGKERIGGDQEDNEEVGRLRFFCSHNGWGIRR